jgi:hypothetical protein
MIHSALVWFRASLRDPSWIAAYALLIQVFIFGWQARILRRHATTLEEHTEIARAQATTADLIRQAVQQQEVILNAQFNFQQRLQTQAEKKAIFDLMVQLYGSVQTLTTKVNAAPSTQKGLDEITQCWIDMKKYATACTQALVTSAHLSKDGWECFLTYISDVGKLHPSSNQTAEYNQLRDFNDKHKDFLALAIQCVGTEAIWQSTDTTNRAAVS